MKKLFALLLLVPVLSFAQEMKTIIANTNSVNLKIDGKLKKNAWRITPDVSPDVYATNAKTVVFYTDKEEITIHPTEGKPYDFIIDLNGKKALTRVQYEPSYLELLKKGEAYNLQDTREFPAFAYTPSTDANLQKLRKEYNLDSVAGKGDEVFKIKNLMRWVHNTITHDGGGDNPLVKNANGIIKVCKAEGLGVNCRMMATVLNECYLAMGFKSRFITCMPRDLEFDDCHVINIVYSNQLGKWLWMDPTFEAFVMDDKKNLLSVEEVRERLISGKPLKLNKEANWNHKNKRTKEDYLDGYMAKNLYRIQATAISTYDTETDKSHPHLDYIELVPLDGLNQKHVSEMTYNSGDKRTFYVTNNPELFWAKP
ncbi:transglutaminase domain-containing protein [Flavobacterium hauense]